MEGDEFCEEIKNLSAKTRRLIIAQDPFIGIIFCVDTSTSTVWLLIDKIKSRKNSCKPRQWVIVKLTRQLV